MDTALNTQVLSIAEYLEGEEQSSIRHEFVNRRVCAMAGGTREHELITGNLFAALHAHLRGGPCRAFMSNLEVHPQISDTHVFYYPDISVTCDPRDTNRLFNSYPSVIIEVLSESTARVDWIEKLQSYTQIESLQECVLIEQSRQEVHVLRRRAKWQQEKIGEGDTLNLESLQFSMHLADLYDGV